MAKREQKIARLGRRMLVMDIPKELDGKEAVELLRDALLPEPGGRDLPVPAEVLECDAHIKAMSSSLHVANVVEGPADHRVIALPAHNSPADEFFLECCAKTIFDALPVFRPDGVAKMSWQQAILLRPELAELLKGCALLVLGEAEARIAK